MSMRVNKLFRITLSVFFLSLPIIGYSQKQALYDWAMLRNYQPPVEVVQLASDTTMNDTMRRLFYVYRPSIEDKTIFNTSCRKNEQTIVLGCYVEGGRIHLFNVTDSRLAGVEEVTAAHEALHAAYNRLNRKERQDVDAMTASAFLQIRDNRVKDTIELYRKQDPSIVPNELHSILGTEVRNLPADLEAYYLKYFNNRLKIVGYFEQYEQAFTDRKNQIKAYDSELASLKMQIESLQKELDTLAKTISDERARLDALKISGNITAYNSGVNNYNRSVAGYNSKIDQLSSLISKYNEIVPKRNEIASEEQELVKAIDSRETVPARQ